VPRERLHLALRINAAFFLVFGGLLLLAPTTDLYESLGLPVAEPEVYAQLAGGAMLVIALLLWEAPVDPVLERHVGRAAAMANALTALVLFLWLVTGEIDAERGGQVILGAAAVISAAFAAIELRYLRAQR
jgi:hypothetical protein